MAEVAGWIVALAVAIIAVLWSCVRNARERRSGPVGFQSDAEAGQRLKEIKHEAQADLEALWDDLESDDPEAAIASAADAARDQR